ncbi:hypothetical protein K458DRAFT_425038, partial [Lentithecium fluviatile CBS 122367]
MEPPTHINTVRDDTKFSLSTLRAQAGKPLRDIVLEIHKQQWKPNNKSLEFQRNLRCFLPAEPAAGGRPPQRGQGRPGEIWLTPCSQVDNYVALSYPWTPSYGEDNTTGRYRLPGETIEVRNIVFDRTISFIQYKCGSRGMIPFWMDRISIHQKDTPKKEKYMQSMDLVYQRCTFAIGYLWVEVKTQLQVDHLSSLLGGHMVEETVGPQPVLKGGIDEQTSHQVLDLLVQITDDQWWSRAWIFQEDYFAGTKMWLLIRHAPGLEKPRAAKLGTLSGELVVKSDRLRKYATLFCLALHARDKRQLVRNACKRVLQRAGKYNILHRYKRSGQRTMTVSVFTDLSMRDITVPSDLLAIAANVCGYDARILTAKNAPETSLSLGILTLCMLNGEIISDDDGETACYGNILDFLRNRTMRINAPLADGALTFIKHSRLSVSHLSTTGIHTRGVLWKLSDPIHPQRLRQCSYAAPENRSQRDLYRDGLSHYQRSRLFDLLRVLTQRNKLHGRLVKDLKTYLAVHDRPARRDDWPPEYVMDVMAAYLVNAMDTGKYLQVARLVSGSAGAHDSRYRAIFVRDCNEIKRSGPTHVFTSWARTKEQIQEDVKCKSLAKYVSIEVSLDKNEQCHVRSLRSRGWTNGLCFFRGEIKSPFVFAWPKSLN